MDRLAGRVVSCRDDVGDASAGVIDSFMGNNEERLRIYGESRVPRVSPSNEAGGVKRYATFDANRSVMLRQKALSEHCHCSLVYSGRGPRKLYFSWRNGTQRLGEKVLRFWMKI